MKGLLPIDPSFVPFKEPSEESPTKIAQKGIDLGKRNGRSHRTDEKFRRFAPLIGNSEELLHKKNASTAQRTDQPVSSKLEWKLASSSKQPLWSFRASMECPSRSSDLPAGSLRSSEDDHRVPTSGLPSPSKHSGILVRPTMVERHRWKGSTKLF